MTRNAKVSKRKFLFTTILIIAFAVIVIKADAFSNSVEDKGKKVNAVFIGSEEDRIGINPDNITIAEEGEESPIISYIVESGDSLEKISKEFGVPVKDLKELNKINGPIRPGQKLIVSDNKEGILYVLKRERSLKVFAEYYRLNLEDLMTFNYISDDTEVLYPGQEIFINVTEKRAYDIGLLEKPQPILPKDPVYKPKPKIVTTSNGKTNNTAQITNHAPTSSAVYVANSGKKSRIIKQRYYNPKISNGFAVGYCTWYAAIKTPSIFKYTSETKQERPFGGNAKHRYNNAKNAGYSVGSTPRVGAIIVYDKLRSYAGHVAVVISYNASSGEMIVEDMNYAGKYIVTQRYEDVNRKEIIGYIYP